jgi:serine/threonine protein kinase
LSENCKQLIVSLLNRNPSKRLGAGPEGSEEIKRHPFFEGIDWSIVRYKKLEPPKPEINTKYYQQVQKITEVPDEQLKRVFDDYQETDPDIYENRNVEGWSFVQPIIMG